MKLLALVIATAVAAGPSAGLAQTNKAAAKSSAKNESELRAVLDSSFSRWDRNGDGTLVLTEINALIEDPEVRGDEAAAIVVVRQHFTPKGEASNFTGATRDQLLAVAGDADAARKFKQLRNKIQTINRELFLIGDPNLETFHQGGTGDCYLLSVIGTQLNRDPAQVRDMIHPLPGNGYRVRFGDGRTETVLPLTDAELVMGARMGANHGVWLGVLEKAFASIRKETRDKKAGRFSTEDEATERDLLGGGSTATTIPLLTGHEAASAPTGKWMRENPGQAETKLHDLLTTLTKERKLIAANTGKDDRPLPKHIPHRHAFGIFGYDAATRTVRLFNPWGNDVRPDGPPGLVNGYPTSNGVFEMPLRDFMRVFDGLHYETDKPAKSAPDPSRRSGRRLGPAA